MKVVFLRMSIPLNNQLLKHVRVIGFLNQKSSFESTQFPVEKLQNYVNFTPEELLGLEDEILLLQTVTTRNFTKSALNEATIRVDTGADYQATL